MGLTTSAITGRVPMPNNIAPLSGSVTFTLVGYDTQGINVVPSGAGATFNLADDGNLPSGARLWRNTSGLRGTVYLVTVRWREAGSECGELKENTLGHVQVQNAPSYTVPQLLNAVPPDAQPGQWWMAITQAQYDEMMASVASVREDRLAAEAAANEAAISAAAANIQDYPSFGAMARAQSTISLVAGGKTITAAGVRYLRTTSGASVDGVEGVRYVDGFNSSAILAASSPLGELSVSLGEAEATAALGIGYRRVPVTGDGITYSIDGADHFPAVHQAWPDDSGMIQIDVSGISLDREYVIVNNGTNQATVIIDSGPTVSLIAPWVSRASTINRFMLASGETLRLTRFIPGQIFVQLDVSQLRWVGDQNFGTYYKKDSGGFWTVSFVRTAGISANSESVSSVSSRFDLSESYLDSITVLPDDSGLPYLLKLPQVTKISTRNGLAVNQFAVYNDNGSTWNRPVRFTFTNVKEVFNGI